MMYFYCLTQAQEYEAKEGVLNLKNWNPETDKAIELSGEWKIFWEQFLSSEDIQSNNYKHYKHINQPGTWNRFNYHGRKLPAHGYATLYLLIVLPDSYPEELSIHTGVANTAYNFYVNDILLYQQGKIGKSKKEMTPKRNPGIIRFKTESDSIHIIMQISNYYDHSGGAWSSFFIGSEEQIAKRRYGLLFFDLFLIGAIFIIALYHLGLYFTRRKEYSALFFSIFAFLILIRIFVTGESFLLYLFPETSWKLIVHTEYLSFFISPLFFLLFIKQILFEDIPRMFVKIVIIVSLIFELIVIFLPVNYFTTTLRAFQIFTVTIGLIAFYYMVKAAILNRKGARILLIGFLVFFTTVIHDILYSAQLITSIFLSPFGMFIFIFSQAYLLSVNFARSFSKSERLTDELIYINENLEIIVDERTSEIQQQKAEMQSQAENLLMANEKISKQKNELEDKGKQIESSINYARRIQSAVFPSDTWMKDIINDYFVLLKPRDIVSGDFFWLKKQNDFLLIAVGDCTGHGVPGAFLSLLGVAFLNEILRHSELPDAAEVLEKLRTQFIEALHQDERGIKAGDGIDMAFIVYNTKTGNLQYSGANNPAYYIYDEEFVDFKPVINPIGKYPFEKPFLNTNIQSNKNGIIYLFSDGFYDQINADYIKIKRGRFKTLIKNVSSFDMQRQKEMLEAYFENWKKNQKQIDDVLVMGIKL